MLDPVEKEQLIADFVEAEASLRLEGLAPTEHFFSVKARILNGEITFEQGQGEILTFHLNKVAAVA